VGNAIACFYCMEQQPQSGQQKSRVKTFVIVSLSAAVLLSIGCYLYFRIQSRPTPVTSQSVLSVIHLEPFVVNLADNGEPAYLRIGIDIGTARHASEGNPATPTSMAVIRDTVLEVLTAHKSDGLSTPDGKKVLKEVVLQRLQARAPELNAREVYFTEFLIQK